MSLGTNPGLAPRPYNPYPVSAYPEPGMSYSGDHPAWGAPQINAGGPGPAGYPMLSSMVPPGSGPTVPGIPPEGPSPVPAPTGPPPEPVFTQPGGYPSGGGINEYNPYGPKVNFDQEMWQGPYGAPLTNIQLDSMGSIERMLGADPLVQAGDIQRAIQQSLGGAGPNAPKTDTSGFMQNFGQVFGQAGQSAPSFDTTEMFKNARDLFESDLSGSLNTAREEYSGLGLDPGSSTRAAGLARTGADAASRFGLGMTDIARQGFESAQNRGLQGLNLQAGMLPQQLAGDQIPFQEAMQEHLGGLEGQRMGAGILPAMLQAFNNPAMLAELGFGIGGEARGTAQGELDRMMAEYARTQGGLLPQMNAMMQGPQQQVGYGPSQGTQWGQIITSFLPILIELLGEG